MSVESNRVGIIMNALRARRALSATGCAASVGALDQDDCAVIPITPETDIVVGSDFVRGEGFALFKAGLLTREEVGAYLVGANASDLAAMGATPVGMTLIYRYSESTTDEEFSAIIEGVTSACRQFQMPLLGGDTGSYEVSVLGATAFGMCPRGRSLLRSAGVVNDDLYVTGDVGRAGAAYRYFQVREALPLKVRLSQADETEVLAPWKRVEPALAQGRFLLERELSRCAIDTSDGLFAAAELLGRTSKLDVELYVAAIPARDCVKRAANALGISWVDLAGGVSVDFRLLFSAPALVREQIETDFCARGWPLYRVGRFLRSSGSARVFVIDASGSRRELTDCW